LAIMQKRPVLISFVALSALMLAHCATPTPTAIKPTQASQAGLAPAASVAAMKPLMQEAIDKGLTVGVTFAVSDASGAMAIDSVGFSDKESNTAMTNDRLFRVYSMTKPVTGVAAMILVQEGKLNLDDPVGKYIPSFNNVTVYKDGPVTDMKTEPLERPLLVRDLLRLTAGIPYLGAGSPVEQMHAVKGIARTPGEVIQASRMPPVKTLAELADRTATIPLSVQPGSRWVYGSGLDVMGAVIEVASGQSLGAFMQARIFEPLGMTDTGFEVAARNKDRLASGYFSITQKTVARGYISNLPPSAVGQSTISLAEAGKTSAFLAPQPIHFGGSGLTSTPQDFMKFARMLANKGSLNGKTILNPDSFAELSRNQLSPEAGEKLAEFGIGFGLGIGVVTDSAKTAGAAANGTIYWPGAAGTIFWADPNSGQAGLIMTQVFGADWEVYRTAAMRAARGVAQPAGQPAAQPASQP
jgi:CubicO group peptidase (beta-lactamase class C family)